MKLQTLPACAALIFVCFTSCQNSNDAEKGTSDPDSRIAVIFDTDANNELDDQHALAYLFANQDSFNIVGVTTNATPNGGLIEEHYKEADRIFRLFNLAGEIPLLKGANGSFSDIRGQLNGPGNGGSKPETDEASDTFDGSEAVNFIIGQAKKYDDHELVLLAVGKLTNPALAIEKAPWIKENIRIVWLGSNYPGKGEYNQESDTSALQYLLEQDVPMEIVMVRYGKPSGAAAVYVQWEDIEIKMPGLGPEAKVPVEGRHGGKFNCFGDYSVNLFEHAEYYGDPPHRSLFDAVAVAMLKNPSWGQTRIIPAPELVNNTWTDRPDNPRTITLWEYFDKSAILEDFYSSLGKYSEFASNN